MQHSAVASLSGAAAIVGLQPPDGGWDGCCLWQVDLDALAPTEDEARSLEPFELERAARLRRPRDADRYLAAHWGLRLVLAPLLNRDATSLRLRLDTHLKPHLDHDSAPAFNMSHSGGVAVIAVSDRSSVGVDVEVHTELHDVEALAQQQLSAREWQDFQSLAPSSRSAVFLDAWTRKEAALKALGCGLQIDAASVDLGLCNGATVWAPPSAWSRWPVQVLPSLRHGSLHIALALHDAAMARIPRAA